MNIFSTRSFFQSRSLLLYILFQVCAIVRGLRTPRCSAAHLGLAFMAPAGRNPCRPDVGGSCHHRENGTNTRCLLVFSTGALHKLFTTV
jgi:hypothetical protein